MDSSATNSELICAFCLEIFKDPKTLPCFHSYCLGCLEDYVEGQFVANGQNTFPCPKCRKVVAIPPGGVKKFGKDHLLEHLNREKVISSNRKCRIHPVEELTLFCKDDKKGICKLCLLEKHQKHNLIDLSEEPGHCLVEVNKKIACIKKTEEELEKCATAAMPFYQTHPVVVNFDSKCNKIIAQIRENRQIVLDEDRNGATEQTQMLNKKRNEIQTEFRRITRVKSQIEDILNGRLSSSETDVEEILSTVHTFAIPSKTIFGKFTGICAYIGFLLLIVTTCIIDISTGFQKVIISSLLSSKQTRRQIMRADIYKTCIACLFLFSTLYVLLFLVTPIAMFSFLKVVNFIFFWVAAPAFPFLYNAMVFAFAGLYSGIAYVLTLLYNSLLSIFSFMCIIKLYML